MKLQLIISDVGIFEFNLDKVHSPLTIGKLMTELPLSSRGIKRQYKFIIPIDLKTRIENAPRIFNKGEISHDPSSGNITIHLKISQSITENYLGKIVNDLDKLELLKLSHGVQINNN